MNKYEVPEFDKSDNKRSIRWNHELLKEIMMLVASTGKSYTKVMHEITGFGLPIWKQVHLSTQNIEGHQLEIALETANQMLESSINTDCNIDRLSNRLSDQILCCNDLELMDKLKENYQYMAKVVSENPYLSKYNTKLELINNSIVLWYALHKKIGEVSDCPTVSPSILTKDTNPVTEENKSKFDRFKVELNV